MGQGASLATLEQMEDVRSQVRHSGVNKNSTDTNSSLQADQEKMQNVEKETNKQMVDAYGRAEYNLSSYNDLDCSSNIQGQKGQFLQPAKLSGCYNIVSREEDS